MKKIVCAALLLCLSVASASASELKIGFVDVRAAVAASGLYNKDADRIRALEKKLSNRLAKLERKFVAASKEFKKKNTRWKADTVTAKQKDIVDLEIRIKRTRSDAQQVLKRENQLLDARALQVLDKAVKSYGKEHHYSVILQKGQGILYDDGSIDISSEVGKQMRRVK